MSCRLTADQKKLLKKGTARAKAEGWDSWIRSDHDRLAVIEGYRFDQTSADRVRNFFEKILCHSDGKHRGDPFILLDWQWLEVIGPLFGWLRPDGTRRFRSGYIQIPKKNGKSTLIAGITLALLLIDGEPGAQVYSAATSRDQAGIVYRQAAKMVDASPGLAKYLRSIDTTKTITGPNHSFYRALSSDGRTGDGIDAHGVVIDELHRMRDRSLVDLLEYSGAARAQPIMLVITTAGDDLLSVCGQEYTRAKAQLDGSEDLDIHHLVVIYESNAEDDWTDPETWKKANPSLGHTLRLEELAEQCQKAQGNPAKERNFRRLRLNQWVSIDSAWIPTQSWQSANVQPINAAALKGRPAWIGLDLSATTDTTAVIALVEAENGLYHVIPRIYLPEKSVDGVDRDQRDAAPYRAWAEAGLITLTSGSSVHYARLIDDIRQFSRDYDLREIQADPWNAEAVLQQLSSLDLALTHKKQGFSLSPAVKETRRMIMAGELNHAGHEALGYQVAQAVVVIDEQENEKLNKKRSTGRIDAAVGLVMAVNGARFGDASPFESSYADDNFDTMAPVTQTPADDDSPRRFKSAYADPEYQP